MSATDVLMDLSTPDNASQAEASCPTCPHPVNAHDPISRRFCTATRAGGLTRGCLCSGESTSASYGRTGESHISDRAGRA